VTIRFRNCTGGSAHPRNGGPTAEQEKPSHGARAELDVALPGPRTARSFFAAVVRIRHSPSPTLRSGVTNRTPDGLGRRVGLELLLTDISTRGHAALRSSVFWHG
jgi:hypothetical protein